jgi:hypothetical protein
MKRRIVTVRLSVRTNLDPGTLEDRIENFLDSERLASELLDGERVSFKRTTIDVETPPELWARRPKASKLSPVDVQAFGALLHHASKAGKTSR